MKRKNEVAPIQLCEGSLLIDDCAERDLSATCGVLIDGFESIQMGSVPLSYEVNGRVRSHAQSAQNLVIIEAWGDVGTVSSGTSSSLSGKRGVSGCFNPN